jgi:hypothetical protein
MDLYPSHPKYLPLKMKPIIGIWLIFLLSTGLKGLSQTGDSSVNNKIRYSIRVDRNDWSWQIRIKNLSHERIVRLIKPGFQSSSTYWTLYDPARKEIVRRCLTIDHYRPKRCVPYVRIPPGGDERIDARQFETLDKLFCKIDSADFLEFTYTSANGIQFRSGLLPIASKGDTITYSVLLSF